MLSEDPQLVSLVLTAPKGQSCHIFLDLNSNSGRQYCDKIYNLNVGFTPSTTNNHVNVQLRYYIPDQHAIFSRRF